MLFGYPVAATNENWLHDCLIESIKNIHTAVDAGSDYPGWPDVLPSAHCARLNTSTGLRDRLAKYDKVFRRLSVANRGRIDQVVVEQNKISDLLAGRCTCCPITGLPKPFIKAAKDLFDYAYAKLTDLGLRDSHYRQIYDSTTAQVCPFCGVEYMDPPGAPREDLDHYLAKSLYPFAAANLRNLVPMGHKCNSRYKLAVDILFRDDGARRVAVDPYDHGEIVVRLDDSDPFNGTSVNTPKWDICFAPDSPSLLTWDEVFKVRERYCRDHLNPSFSGWIDLFGRWARSSGLNMTNDAEVVDALKRYELYWNESGFQDRAFLKAAVFRMLCRHCESGHRRLLDLIKDLSALSRASVS